MVMPTHSEYVTKLKKLKLLEEKTLEYLSAIRIAKLETWAHMNHSLGEEMKPKYSFFSSDVTLSLEHDLESMDGAVVLTQD